MNASGITYGEIQDSINSGTGFSIQSTNSDWPSSAGWLLRMLQAAKMEALETFHQRQDQVSAEKQNLAEGSTATEGGEVKARWLRCCDFALVDRTPL